MYLSNHWHTYLSCWSESLIWTLRGFVFYDTSTVLPCQRTLTVFRKTSRTATGVFNGVSNSRPSRYMSPTLYTYHDQVGIYIARRYAYPDQVGMYISRRYAYHDQVCMYRSRSYAYSDQADMYISRRYAYPDQVCMYRSCRYAYPDQVCMYI